MAVLSVAITLSFHLKHRATELERRVAKPLGAVFWLLSVAMLALGLANYVGTVNKYGRRAAIVQSGWRTQLVSWGDEAPLRQAGRLRMRSRSLEPD